MKATLFFEFTEVGIQLPFRGYVGRQYKEIQLAVIWHNFSTRGKIFFAWNSFVDFVISISSILYQGRLSCPGASCTLIWRQKLKNSIL